MEKTCSSCHVTKPIEEFYRNKGTYDNLTTYCKVCTCAKQREYITRPPKNPEPDGLKRCVRCKQTKPCTDFHKSKRTYDGWDKRCKECAYNDHKAWIEKNPNKAAALQKKWRDTNPQRSRDHKLKANYGIPLGTYDTMFMAQHGKCAICGTGKPNKRGHNFSVDHCHETGKVRALLCSNCNVGIGHFFHDKDLLYKAINYLEIHQVKVEL